MKNFFFRTLIFLFSLISGDVFCSDSESDSPLSLSRQPSVDSFQEPANQTQTLEAKEIIIEAQEAIIKQETSRREIASTGAPAEEISL